MTHLLDKKAALDAAVIKKLFAPFLERGVRIALAVSGGPDSMALALCAKKSGVPAIAFIVDHRLRAESSDEANTVQERLGSIGIESEIVQWDHDAVASRVHVRARQARYDLLLEACRRYQITDLLFAHHQGDQAETILMRFAKGSGLDGLSGMAPSSVQKGVTLWRPFLALAKEQLVATCVAASIPYITDPSNQSLKYARGRLRAVSDLLGKEGLNEARLIDFGSRAKEAADAVYYYAASFLKMKAQLSPYGVIDLDLDGFGSLPRAVALKILALCLLTIRPAPYAPERQALLALHRSICSKAEQEARTLGGVEVRKTGQRVRFVRERAPIAENVVLKAGQTVLWDGRWVLSCASDDVLAGLSVRALGEQPKAILDQFAPCLRHDVPQGRARSVLPALWREDKLVLIPCFCEDNQCDVQACLQSALWLSS